MATSASDLSVHTGTSYSPNPSLAATEEESAISGLVHDLFYRAQNARRPLMSKWKKNYRVLNNSVWARASDPWVPQPEVAKIWPVCASIVAWITDQRPMLTVFPSAVPFSPFADNFQMLADQMNALLNANFNEYLLDAEISKCLWDVLTYGIGYSKTVWEPWLADGLGDSVFRRTDPFTVYPDPFARTESQLNYIIEAKVMSTQDLLRAYPHMKDKLPTAFLNIDEAPHKLDATTQPSQPRLNLAPIAPATAPHSGMNTSRRASGQLSDSPTVVVLEAWIRGLVTEEGVTRDTWQVVSVCGQCVIINKQANEVAGHDRHPYDRVVLFDTGEWYGPCLVELLTSPQESINRTLSAIEANLQLMGDPMLVEGPMANSNKQRITNRPGQRISADPSQVAWLNPPVMQPQIAVTLMQYYESQIEAISGMSAMVRGFSPQGRNSSGVMSSIQDAAFVRVRATSRELERMLKSIGRKMTANMCEFYTEPRMLATLGPDGNQITTLLKSRHFYVSDPTSEDPMERVPLRFNVQADAGSQLMTSKEARAQQAMGLYNMGAIDVLELLKAIGWPSWGQVAKRVMSMQAEQGTLGQAPGARQQGSTSQP